MVFEGPEGAQDGLAEAPGDEALAVEAEDAGELVDAPQGEGADIGAGVQTVIEIGANLIRGFAGESFRVDGEPWLAGGGKDVVVVEVAVEEYRLALAGAEVEVKA